MNWITPTFDPSNFIGAPATWIVTPENVTVFRYKYIDDDTMIVQWQIENTSVSGTPTNALRLRVPDGRLTKWNQNAWCQSSDAGTASDGYVETGPGNFVIACVKKPVPENYSNSSGNTSIYGQIILELLDRDCGAKNSVQAINFPSAMTLGDLTSIVLGTGKWDITGTLFAVANGASMTEFLGGISTTPGNDFTGLVSGDSRMEATPPNAVNNSSISIPSARIELALQGSVYLKYLANYSGGMPTAYGRLSAIRAK